MESIRPAVVGLAVASAAAPAAIVGLALAPALLGVRLPAGLLYAALVGYFGLVAGRMALTPRLTATERGVVSFWSTMGHFIVPLAAVLGALPLLVLYALGVPLAVGWVRAVALVAITLATLLVWQMWLHQRSALPRD